VWTWPPKPSSSGSCVTQRPAQDAKMNSILCTADLRIAAELLEWLPTLNWLLVRPHRAGVHVASRKLQAGQRRTSITRGHSYK